MFASVDVAKQSETPEKCQRVIAQAAGEVLSMTAINVNHVDDPGKGRKHDGRVVGHQERQRKLTSSFNVIIIRVLLTRLAPKT